MPTKPLSNIALILFIPVAVLIFLAVRSLSLENDALNARRDRLVKQNMNTAAVQLNGRLQSLGGEVLAKTAEAYDREGPEALTKGARKRQYIYAFIFKDGTTLHSATALEHQYDLARAFQDNAQTLAQSLNAGNPSAAALVHAGANYAFLSCTRNAGGEDVCVAIDNAEVSRVLQSALASLEQSTGLARMGLIAPNKMMVGWGGSDAAGSTLPLDGILHDWILRSDAQPEHGQSQNTLFLYIIGSLFITGWAMMTWMLHRSSVLKEEAASARAGVVAQLAHELRTPLTNLRLHTELLSRRAEDVSAVQRYTSVLLSEIERLSSVAENAIVVARGAMTKPKLETAIPDACLQSVLDRFDPTLSEAKCQIEFHPGAGAATLFDRTSWERCVVNLIDNARKYAPGTRIEISTEQRENMLRLCVSDRGPGIAAGQLEQIFEPLERGATKQQSGFGLGLAAVRALARQNDGECWAENNNPGARFVLTMKAVPQSGQDAVTGC